MRRARRSRDALCFVSCLPLWATGCGAQASEAGVPLTPTGNTFAEKPPQSVPVDPPFELPQAEASTTATNGLAVLAAPPDPAPIRRTVAAFFDAVVAESTMDLERVVDPAARTRASSKARPDPALSWWRRRFDALDYKALATEVFFLPSALEIRTARDKPADSAAAALPALPRGEEVVVRVPIVGKGTSKLFGSEIVFLLKPDSRVEAAYRIAELYEDFRLP